MSYAGRVRRAKRTGLLVNGYPDGEQVARRADVWARWRRRQDWKKEKEAEMAAQKLSEMSPLTLLDCSYSARDLFNVLPKLSPADQTTLVDYIEMRLAMWRDTLPASATAAENTDG